MGYVSRRFNVLGRVTAGSAVTSTRELVRRNESISTTSTALNKFVESGVIFVSCAVPYGVLQAVKLQKYGMCYRTNTIAIQVRVQGMHSNKYATLARTRSTYR